MGETVDVKVGTTAVVEAGTTVGVEVGVAVGAKVGMTVGEIWLTSVGVSVASDEASGSVGVA